MKITREEFKEYINLYEQAWDKFDKHADIIDSNFLDSLIFPLFDWVDNKIGIRHGYIIDILLYEEGPVDWDKVYDELKESNGDGDIC